MQFLNELQNLGLTDKEAKVYIALLRLGSASAYAIAEESGLKRPTTYIILDELRKKGLANKVPRAKKQIFIPRSPEEYFASLEERLSGAKKILPQLMAFADGKKQKPKTLFFEGLKKIKDVYAWHIKQMKGKEITGFYAHAGEETPELKKFFWDLAEEFKKNDVHIRGVVPEHPNLEEYREADKRYDRDFKILPFEEYSSDISIEITDNYVIFFNYHDQQITFIENKDIARTMKQIFELVWEKK